MQRPPALAYARIAERDSAIRSGYANEGLAGYVWTAASGS